MMTHLSYPNWTARGRADKSRHIADIFKCIFENYNLWISTESSLVYVNYGLIDSKAALVQVMACRTDEKPLSEPAMAKLTDTYMCHSATMSEMKGLLLYS